MNIIKNKIKCFTVVFFISLLAFQLIPLYQMKKSKEVINLGSDPLLADAVYTKQWINNSNFDSVIDPWYSSYEGDLNDVEAVYEQNLGYANLSVLGDSGIYSLTGIPNSTWQDFANDDWGVFMNQSLGEQGIDSNGLWVSYEWDEQTDQTGNTPSVHWKQNITLPIDMSDYKITSASLEVTFNATVTVSPVDGGGIDVADDVVDDIRVGDYAKFYVLISDIENVYQPFQVAHNRTTNLGRDTPSTPTISDRLMTPINEALLIDYLELVLGVNSTEFTMTLGIDLYCEDNDFSYDDDIWDDLRIKYYNLTFTYERIINQFTSISWNQDGEKPSDISNNTIVVNEALLEFEYKINDTWSSISPNSEIRILINDIQHSETIKLSTATNFFQPAKPGGFDVTSLIDENKNINLSLQVYLADEFELNRTITISLDNVYLNITYTEIVPDTLTSLHLFLNSENKTLDPVITLPLGVNLNITVRYVNQTGGHISNATISLEGKVISPLSENNSLQHYSTIINTSDVGIGVRILTVVAQKNLFETQNFPFFIEVTERDTELQLFLNEIPKNDSDSIQLEIDESINVTVKYRDLITGSHLSNATVNLLGIGVLNETNNQYTLSINESDLGQGITVLTIFAQLINFQPQSIQFFVEVIERKTEIILFVDGVPKNDGDTIQVELYESINVTVYYRDDETKAHLTNASVVLVGRGTLDEINNQYNISINAQDLDQDITVLTIFGQLTNYQSQSIQFFVEVVERSTGLQLLLNNEEKTFDPVYNLIIGQSLNFTLKYTDNQTGQHINTATLQLIGEGLLLDLTRDNILGQYYIVLDTTTLGIGVKLFTIVAQATNYQIKTIDPRITVNRISATINTENGISQIEVDVGENVLLQVVLNDTIFGGTITNATVTYRWAYGQGELVDSNNDSIYEATLPNVQSGVDDITVYHITITAFAGDDYNFESFEITLIVSQPTTQPGTDLSWLVFVLIGAILGLVTIFIFYQTYFKYPPLVRKMRKLKKRIKKGKKAKPIIVSSREEISNKNFEDQKKVLELEIVQHQPDKIKKLNKNSIKKEEEM